MYTCNLRPHHGLCIQFYRGEGYSAEFVAHMNQLIENVKNTKITITFSADEICKKCPKNNEGICLTQDSVGEIDQAVAYLCRLKDKQEMLFEDFLHTVKEKVIRSGEMRKICQNCSWSSICLETIS